MPHEPQIGVLPYRTRVKFFWVLFLVFAVSLPAFIFYTTGYRISLESDEPTIVTTGGLYVSTDDREVEIYVDEELIANPRFFQSAYYVQNISAGVHRVVAQASNRETWVKELPVESYRVTEAQAFNLPLVPQVSVVTEYETSTGTPILLGVASTTAPDVPFLSSSSSTAIVFATTTATSGLVRNPEFTLITTLLDEATTTDLSMFDRMVEVVEDRFRFATTAPATTTMATSAPVRTRGDIELTYVDGEVVARWTGRPDLIPYYFCVASTTLATTTEWYGAHVANAIAAEQATGTAIYFPETNRVCRTEIRIDRRWQTVRYYHFVPNERDLVLLHLQDGVYVVEIDDRSWQNVQLLYPGENLRVVVTDDDIFIQEAPGYYLQVATEIATE